VPAAAVIPAPIAYIKVVAVKKLVVGSRDAHLQASRAVGSNRRCVGVAGSVRWRTSVSTGPPVPSFWIPVPAIELVGTSQGAVRRRQNRRAVSGAQIVYREKIRVFKAGRHQPSATEYISMG